MQNSYALAFVRVHVHALQVWDFVAHMPNLVGLDSPPSLVDLLAAVLLPPTPPFSSHQPSTEGGHSLAGAFGQARTSGAGAHMWLHGKLQATEMGDRGHLQTHR